MGFTNAGQLGVKSIRLAGKTIEELPWWVAAQLRENLALAEDTERQIQIAGVLKRYPTQTPDYINSRIAEAEQNIKRLGDQEAREHQTISDYTGLIGLCDHRDRELEKMTDPDEIKALKNKFPPYNVAAMHKQIGQCKDSITRFNAVVVQEYRSLSELRECLLMCRQRDLELRKLGVSAR